jgi:hypothetical protein
MDGIVIILTVAAAIVFFLAIRELVTWYWKIDKLVAEIQKQNDILIAIHDLLKADQESKKDIKPGESIQL